MCKKIFTEIFPIGSDVVFSASCLSHIILLLLVLFLFIIHESFTFFPESAVYSRVCIESIGCTIIKKLFAFKNKEFRYFSNHSVTDK